MGDCTITLSAVVAMLVHPYQAAVATYQLSKGGGSSHKLVRPGSGCGQRQFMGVVKDKSWVWSGTIYTLYSEYFIFLSIVNNC